MDFLARALFAQGVDGGIMNEGTVEMEEQRKAGTQASRIKAMLQGEDSYLLLLGFSASDVFVCRLCHAHSRLAGRRPYSHLHARFVLTNFN